MIDNTINLDSAANSLITKVYPNQKKLTISTPSISQPIGISVLPAIIQPDSQNKKDKITKIMITNNIIYDSQQVKTIMI